MVEFICSHDNHPLKCVHWVVLLSASHTGLTTMLRPSCDLKMLESWEDRRRIARLVAEVVGDRG